MSTFRPPPLRDVVRSYGDMMAESGSSHPAMVFSMSATIRSDLIEKALRRVDEEASSRLSRLVREYGALMAKSGATHPAMATWSLSSKICDDARERTLREIDELIAEIEKAKVEKRHR